MNEALSKKWGEIRGLKVVSIGLNPITLPEEDAELIKQAQRTAMMRDPNMAAATLVGAQSDAMRAAASNEGGAMTGFMGLGMAQNAGGMNAQNLFAMGQQQQQQQQQQEAPPVQPAQGGWTCSCGTQNTGKFCSNCGSQQPAPAGGWKCSCGTDNTGKFCSNCGNPAPAVAKCGNCGFEPEDPNNLPKFCPECGNSF